MVNFAFLMCMYAYCTCRQSVNKKQEFCGRDGIEGTDEWSGGIPIPLRIWGGASLHQSLATRYILMNSSFETSAFLHLKIEIKGIKNGEKWQWDRSRKRTNSARSGRVDIYMFVCLDALYTSSVSPDVQYVGVICTVLPGQKKSLGQRMFTIVLV